MWEFKLKGGTTQFRQGSSDHATTGWEKGKALINLATSDDGRISAGLNDYYQLVSILYHESLHALDYKNDLLTPGKKHWYNEGHHARIRLAQMNQKGIWENVPSSYHNEVRGKFRGNLLAAQHALYSALISRSNGMTQDIYDSELKILNDMKSEYEKKFNVTLSDEGFGVYVEKPNN